RFHDTNLNAAIMAGKAGKTTGVVNMPGSLQLIAGTADGTTANWKGVTNPHEITDTFEGVYDAIYSGSKGMLIPNTVVFPTKVMTRLRRQNSLANGDSII